MVVVHAFNPSTWEAEADGSLWVQDQPGLQKEFQDCYTKPKEKETKATVLGEHGRSFKTEQLNVNLGLVLLA